MILALAGVLAIWVGTIAALPALLGLLAFEPDLVVAQSWQTAGAINN